MCFIKMASSLYSIPIPIGTGGYHFQLGPIGYVANWSFGVPYPVYGIPFGQPYVVVSPYSQPNAPPGSNVVLLQSGFSQAHPWYTIKAEKKKKRYKKTMVFVLAWFVVVLLMSMAFC